MVWYICFYASLGLLLAGIAGTAVIRRAKRRTLPIRSPIHFLFGGVMAASVLMFIPVYLGICAGRELRFWESLLLSIHTVFRLFVMDGEMSFVMDNAADIPAGLFTPYFFLSAVLFLLAPMLTIGFVLSFFQNLTAHMRFRRCTRAPLYIFSEINACSLALAKDVAQQSPDRRIVFAGVSDQSDDNSFDWMQAAHQLGAICFKDDVMTLPLKRHRKNAEICLFVIGSDESENLERAICLIDKYSTYDNLSLYVFCEQTESEMLLYGPVQGDLLVRRINPTQAFVLHDLYTDGQRLFAQAIPTGTTKLISVLIVGLDAFGTELLRVLPWFCQMDGYQVQIHAFDPDPRAYERFALLCPELIDPAHNGNFTDDGEAQYFIQIHDGTPTDGLDFYRGLDAIRQVSAIFVALPSDSENIRVSAKLRAYFERRGLRPSISAVVCSSEKKESLQGAVNYSGQPYDIAYIGDVQSVYTEKVLIRSELEAEALKRHLRWGTETSFWKYEYNHKSSLAAAIHARMKILCGIPGAALPTQARTDEQREQLRRLEHRRWNAYMRSEGYVYSGSTEKASRNNLGKMHHCLVTYDLLSAEDRQKDDD